MQKPLCIYHGNCADGFGAAWVVRKANRAEIENGEGAEPMEFYPGFYQTPPPDVTGRHVIMVDFSYKSPVLLEMAAKAQSILILDHHKTAEADLLDIELKAPNVKTVFDMNRSGARITWDYFYPRTKPPRLIDVIEDRDLWRFSLGQEFTREVQACLFSFPYDFDTWTGLMAMPVQDMRRDGAAIERKHFKDIKELLAVVMHWRTIGDYIIPVASLPYTLSSDAGQMMYTTMDAPFAACYWDTAEGRVYSLRSRPEFDCSAIAKQYGGGGHKNAAGFKVDKNHPLATREVDSEASRGPKFSTNI